MERSPVLACAVCAHPVTVTRKAQTLVVRRQVAQEPGVAEATTAWTAAGSARPSLATRQAGRGRRGDVEAHQGQRPRVARNARRWANTSSKVAAGTMVPRMRG